MNALIQPLEGLNEYEKAREWLRKVDVHPCDSVGRKLLSQRESERFQNSTGHVTEGIFQLLGCTESQKLHMAYGLAGEYSYHLIITYQEQRAKEIYEEYSFSDKKALLYPAKDFIFFAADIHGNLLLRQRMEVVKALLEQEQVTVITTIDGCMDCIPELELLKEQVLHVNFDTGINMEVLQKQLLQMGYERTHQIEKSGQFCVRGGIVDVFSLTEPYPFRIEFWGDEIDSIRTFDVESQRSIENLSEIHIYPASELTLTPEQVKKGVDSLEKDMKKAVATFRKQMKTEEAHRLQTIVEELIESIREETIGMKLDSYIPYFTKDTVSFLDYFPKEDTLITLDEPVRLSQKCKAVEMEFRESMMNRLEKGYFLAKQTDVLYDSKEIIGKLNRCRCVAYSILEQQQNMWDIARKEWINVKSVQSYRGDFEMLVKDLKYWKKNGYQVLLLSPSKTRAKRLAQDFLDYELNSFYSEEENHSIQAGEIMTTHGNLRKGYEYPLLKFVVLSESDIFGIEKKKKKRNKYDGQKISDFNELRVGDYVVHENHGLGIYRGIEKIEVEKKERDYIKIEYGEGGCLYILATQLELIQKYSGSDAKKPKLNKLGTQDWTKAKKKVQKAVEEIARDLVQLYAVRQEKEGHQYGEDTIWQREFEELFPFEETEDQLLAIEATKRDMESRKIMDRLICGDVGYGKTEIAIRAAFKAVQESRQVVYLVPTTILAQQHYTNFAQRMKDYPIRVELLCRFRTPAQQRRTIEDLKKGLVDIVIGTHRVLSADIAYKDLGLLIIDEEQRFGVAHKEKIKKLKDNVDVLTLTATPIPRTLHMSLIGIRDMSVLEEAPMDRVPIQTYVMEYDEEMIREALNRELARGGQVYYVYNRVRQIEEMASKIAALVPDANVAYAHGQLREHQLEKIMYEFINQEIDILISTTIIETGLDISNVNTIIIHDADRFGLSQLYQLRGRVGRSNRTAYAFFMYKRNKMLKEVAEKRLQAIRDFTELGSGIKIAMRDLEIRGAGNLLGERQHGHMEAVGYDLYCKMLNEAVRQFKGTTPDESFQTTIELNVDAYIPMGYISNEFQKLDIYKRIAGLENEKECDDMREELLDRFGDLPDAVENLFSIAMIKAKANQLYITEISGKNEYIRFTMYERADINPVTIPELISQYAGLLVFKPEAKPYFIYRLVKNNKSVKQDILQIVDRILEDMKIFKN